MTAVPNLALFETVDTQKLATKLNKELTKLNRENPLPVLVQVNTSGETTKSGVPTEEVSDLVTFIRTDCPLLRFKGLMAMGALNDIEGFQTMSNLRDALVAPDLDQNDFVLSMGTSQDFEAAI